MESSNRRRTWFNAPKSNTKSDENKRADFFNRVKRTNNTSNKTNKRNNKSGIINVEAFLRYHGLMVTPEGLLVHRIGPSNSLK
jgi:hypothetical protein